MLTARSKDSKLKNRLLRRRQKAPQIKKLRRALSKLIKMLLTLRKKQENLNSNGKMRERPFLTSKELKKSWNPFDSKQKELKLLRIW